MAATRPLLVARRLRQQLLRLPLKGGQQQQRPQEVPLLGRRRPGLEQVAGLQACGVQGNKDVVRCRADDKQHAIMMDVCCLPRPPCIYLPPRCFFCCYSFAGGEAPSIIIASCCFALPTFIKVANRNRNGARRHNCLPTTKAGGSS